MEEKRRESNRREGRKGGKKEKERKYDQKEGKRKETKVGKCYGVSVTDETKSIRE